MKSYDEIRQQAWQAIMKRRAEQTNSVDTKNNPTSLDKNVDNDHVLQKARSKEHLMEILLEGE